MKAWRQIKKFEEYKVLFKLMGWFILCIGTLLAFLILLSERL